MTAAWGGDAVTVGNEHFDDVGCWEQSVKELQDAKV